MSLQLDQDRADLAFYDVDGNVLCRYSQRSLRKKTSYLLQHSSFFFSLLFCCLRKFKCRCIVVSSRSRRPECKCASIGPLVDLVCEGLWAQRPKNCSSYYHIVSFARSWQLSPLLERCTDRSGPGSLAAVVVLYFINGIA
jgi:hypothetical protein